MLTIERVRAWYDEQDPVHGFDHVLRVLKLAERLGEELGADREIIRAAVLLHDASGAAPGGEGHRGDHERSSAGFAKEVLSSEGWQPGRIEAVLHCIRAHRFRNEELPTTLEAKIVFDADKLDVMGAYGAARTVGYAVQAGQPIFWEPSATFRETGKVGPGEHHSAYHEYLFKLSRVKDRLFTEPAQRMGERRHRVLTLFFEEIAREARGEE